MTQSSFYLTNQIEELEDSGNMDENEAETRISELERELATAKRNYTQAKRDAEDNRRKVSLPSSIISRTSTP